MSRVAAAGPTDDRVDAAPPSPEGGDVPRPYRVVGHRDETDDVVTLRVVPLDGPLPRFEPGQFSMIGVVGQGDVPISITSRVDDDAHEFTLRRAGAVTNALADAVEGDVITARGPFGTSWNLERASARRALFVGGGIGLAPLRAAVESVLAVPLSTRPETTVVVGAGDPSAIIYRDWLDELVERGARVVQTVDRTLPGRVWGGSVGLVTEVLAAPVGRAGSAGAVEAYVCGPDRMMAATVHELRRVGVPLEQIEVTLERNMQCATGWCGHCQLGPLLVCRDGPVVGARTLGSLLERSEL